MRSPPSVPSSDGREVSALDKNDLTFRLSGTDVPSGQIPLDALGRISSSVQELATRVGRHVVGQMGSGRTLDSAARVVRLRLTGMAAGSTVLEVAFGDHDVLDLDVGVESEIADRFWEVIDGIGAGQRPSWTTPLVAESARRVVDAVASAAERIEIGRGDGRRCVWPTAQVDRQVWMFARVADDDRTVTVVGRLEKVDLRDRRFRIRDDVGNTISLEEVADAEAAGPLVGRRTAATGAAGFDSAGRLRTVSGARLEAAQLPPGWTSRASTDLNGIVAAAPGPDPAGVAGLSDAEVDELLAALRA